MATLLLDYTALDAAYTHGKFRYISGDNSATPPAIGDPADTRIDDIRAYLDTDPVLFSYLNGTAPRALLVNIATNFSTGTSQGKYTACVPSLSGSIIGWDYLKDSGGGESGGGGREGINNKGEIRKGK
jgi:hypothetical protein